MYAAGCQSYENLGDNVLLEAYKKLFSSFNLVIYGGGSVLSIPTKLMKISGCAILAGGTLINRWGLSAFKECMDLFPSICVFGTGVAQPGFWSGRPGWKDTLEEWKSVLQRCNYVGVRGPLSAECLTDAGIDNVEVVGDPVIVYAKDKWSDTQYAPKTLGLNIGTSLGNVWGSEESICSEYIKLAEMAKKSGWQVKWFVVWPKDLSITQKAAHLSGTTEYIYQIYKDHNEYLRLVEQLSTFVGMKLHAVVLATCAYVPSIMLEYRPKCRDYMMSIGQQDHTIRTDIFKAEDVWEIVSNWNSKRESLSNALYKSIKQLRDKQRIKAEELTKVLKAYNT